MSSLPPNGGGGKPRTGAEMAFGFGGSADVIPEGPTMRSVAMMAPPSMAGLGLSLGVASAKLPSLGPLSRGLKGPPIGLKPLSAGARGASFTVQKEWSASSVWNVKGEDLELVPIDYPLERTHREIPTGDATEVATRISDALRTLSIEAEFDSENAKAKCKTNDFCSFRIRLYAGGENGLPVVVEVQRRCGSASSFMRTCRALLSAAEGKTVDSKVTQKEKLPPFNAPPISQMKCLQTIELPSIPADDGASAALDRCMDMLRAKQRDSNVLGLENLCGLTDPVKTSLKVAVRVSKCVALGDEKYDIREEIQVLTERDVFEPGFDDEEGNARHAEHVRHLAMSAFANAFGVCAKDGCLTKAVDEQKWFTDHFVPVLLDEIKRAETSSCNAHQAASCVYSLVSTSKKARKSVIDQGGVSALKSALEYGKVFHEMLADEAERCLQILEAAA